MNHDRKNISLDYDVFFQSDIVENGGLSSFYTFFGMGLVLNESDLGFGKRIAMLVPTMSLV